MREGGPKLRGCAVPPGLLGASGAAAARQASRHARHEPGVLPGCRGQPSPTLAAACAHAVRCPAPHGPTPGPLFIYFAGFPTIKFFGEDKERPEDYNGGRDSGSLAAFATQRWAAQQPPPEVRAGVSSSSSCCCCCCTVVSSARSSPQAAVVLQCSGLPVHLCVLSTLSRARAHTPPPPPPLAHTPRLRRRRARPPCSHTGARASGRAHLGGALCGARRRRCAGAGGGEAEDDVPPRLPAAHPRHQGRGPRGLPAGAAAALLGGAGRRCAALCCAVLAVLCWYSGPGLGSFWAGAGFMAG